MSSSRTVRFILLHRQRRFKHFVFFAKLFVLFPGAFEVSSPRAYKTLCVKVVTVFLKEKQFCLHPKQQIFCCLHIHSHCVIVCYASCWQYFLLLVTNLFTLLKRRYSWALLICHWNCFMIKKHPYRAERAKIFFRRPLACYSWLWTSVHMTYLWLLIAHLSSKLWCRLEFLTLLL